MKKITNIMLLLVLAGSLNAAGSKTKMTGPTAREVNYKADLAKIQTANLELGLQTKTPHVVPTRITKAENDEILAQRIAAEKKVVAKRKLDEEKRKLGEAAASQVKEVEAKVEEVEAKTPGFFRRNKGKLIAGSSIAATAALGTALALFFPEYADTAINYAFSLFSKTPEVISQAFDFTTQSSATEYLIKSVASKAPGIVTQAAPIITETIKTGINSEDLSIFGGAIRAFTGLLTN
jgi:putative cell wall-binding protein